MCAARKTLTGKNAARKVIVYFLCVLPALVFAAFFLLVLYTNNNPGIGSSGIYVCNYVDSTGTVRPYSKLTVHQDNTCALVNYTVGQSGSTDAFSEKHYNWSIRYMSKRTEGDDDRIPFSCFHFSFNSELGASMFQYYFFPSEGKMVSRTYNYFFSDGLMVFVKQ